MNKTKPYSDFDDFEGSAMGSSTYNESEITTLTYTEDNSFYFESINGTGELKHSNQFDKYSSSDEEEQIYPTDMILFASICMIMFAQMAFVGNFISILALSKSKKLRKVTTAFVVNICVSEFFQSCSNLVSSAMLAKKKQWNGGDKSCSPFSILYFYFGSVTMVALIAITLNRFILIVYPRIYHALYSKRNVSIIIAITWLFPMALILTIYFKAWRSFGYDQNSGECAIINKYGETEPLTLFAGYVFPLALLILCYASIFYVVRKAERKMKCRKSNIMSYITHLSDKFLIEAQENGTGQAKYKHLRNKKEWRIFQMIMVIIVCYFLCFIPLVVMKVLRKEREYPRTYIVSNLGIHLATVLNPIIYVVMSEDYRQAYKELLTCSRKPQ